MINTIKASCFDHIRTLVKSIPNDAELGCRVRNFVCGSKPRKRNQNRQTIYRLKIRY